LHKEIGMPTCSSPFQVLFTPLVRQSGLFALFALVVLAGAFAPAAGGQVFDLDASRIPITMVDSTWRFHLGDDARWAGADLDDSSWPTLHPTEDWERQGYPKNAEFAWFRFHLLAPAHTHSLVLKLPTIHKSYQLFCDGKVVSQVGTLPPGPAHNVIGADRVFTLPVNTGAAAMQVTVALRVWQDPTIAGTRSSVLDGDAYVGEPAAVLDQFDTEKKAGLLEDAGGDYTFGILRIIIGSAAVLLFWLTRERYYLWFGVYIALEVLFMVFELLAEHQAWSFYPSTFLTIALDLLAGVAFSFFVVESLNPSSLKPVLLPVGLDVLAEISIILVLSGTVPLKIGDIGYCVCVAANAIVLGWYLIRGWRAGNVDAKLLFFPFAVNEVEHLMNNAADVLRDLNHPWAMRLLPSRIVFLREPFKFTLTDFTYLVFLLGMLAVLVYRFARTSRDQQRLSALMRAARDIQNRLVPVNIPSLGGLTAEIAYHAAEEVGGDFCQILPRRDGSTLVAIGDVSGKGLQAAMFGAVAVGALRSLADELLTPARVLERLNTALLRTDNAGFVTCLCIVFTPDGEILVANAGHLSPYLDGDELPLQPGLPLGILPDAVYGQSSFLLPRTARLTLLSDGVIEARSASGELFGFDRTMSISRMVAAEIAEHARRYGQEDDITVITLDWKSTALAAA